MKDWRVSLEYNGSDHNTIEFYLDTDKNKTEPLYQYHKADWTKFQQQLNDNPMKIPAEMTERRLEKCLDKFYTSLNNALKNSCPKRKAKTVDKNNPWWTKQFQQRRRELNRLFRRRNQSEESEIAFREAESR